MKWIIGYICVALFGINLATAHVGSPAVVCDGLAGPYAVRVIVLPPPVIPGRAEINVRMLGQDVGPVKVTVLPVSALAGLAGAPPPDLAEPVSGEAGLYHGELWLMSSGSYSVHVTIAGSRGGGALVVPVVAAATRTLGMSVLLKAVLVVLGVILLISAATLLSLGLRQSLLPPGVETRGGVGTMAVVFLVLCASVYGGKRWWDAVDANYRHNEIYHASLLDGSLGRSDAHTVLHLAVGHDGTYGGEALSLIPDHGKLMHLFLIREPQLDVLAHLHPARSGPRSFDVILPELPEGHYRVYSDITYETGFAATLTTAIDLSRTSALVETKMAAPKIDPDDSWWKSTSETNAKEEDWLRFVGERRFKKGEDVNLVFKGTSASGQPVNLSTYMGMLGHAAVRRSDGSVFAHIHPVGTFSMAAEDFFNAQRARDLGLTPMVDHSHHHPAAATSEVSFPYVFPQSGNYRIWAQTKIGDRVVTGVADVSVD